MRLSVIFLAAMGYFIRPDFAFPAASPAAGGNAGAEPSSDAASTVSADRQLLLHGNPAARQAALERLVAARAERALTECLADGDIAAGQLAAAGLWEIWTNEAGPAGRQRLEEGVEAMGQGDFEASAALFKALSKEFPAWAEVVNKLATVRYLQGELEESITLCRQVLAKKPDHFGAWNGLALCAVGLEDWGLALEAVRECLRIQPRSVYNQQLLKLVESRLQTT